MCKLFKFSLILFVNFVLLNSVSAQWIKLHGMVEENTVKLYWETHDWPDNLYGFNIKRMEEGTNEWIKLNKETISPQFNENNDWSNQGMNNEQVEYIKGKFTEYLDLGKINLIKNERLLELLKKAAGLKSGDRIRMKNDFDLAFIAGFGFIDNVNAKEKKYTYGIFYVQDDGKEMTEPEDTFVFVSVDELEIELAFEKKRKGIKTSWKMSSGYVKSLGVYGFNVYRSSKGIKSLEKINKRPLGSQKTEQDTLTWNYNDDIADNSKNYTYAIAPINMFQKEIKQFVKEYDAGMFQTIEVPSIDSLQLVNDIQILIEWKNKFSKKELKRIKEFRVERTEARQLEFESVSNNLADNSEQFIDTVKKVYGKVYAYRLVIIDTNNKSWYSKPKNMLFVGELKPPKPINARAEFKMIKGVPNIILMWDPVSKEDTITKGCFISILTSGNYIRLGSVPVITNNQYNYQINSNGGKEYNIAITPVSVDGVHGSAAFVKCYVPIINVPSVTDFDVSLTDEYKIKLKWSFPDSIPVKGFNILLNGKTIAKHNDVDSVQRKWIITNSEFEKDGVNNFMIQSVGELSIANSTEKSIYLQNRIQKRTILRPENLKAKIIKEKKDVGVLLEWDKVDLDKEEILGFILYVDDKKEGVLMKQAAIPLIKQNEYLYKVQDTKRKRYTFGIAAMTKKRIVGYNTKIEINLSKKKKSE